MKLFCVITFLISAGLATQADSRVSPLKLLAGKDALARFQGARWLGSQLGRPPLSPYTTGNTSHSNLGIGRASLRQHQKDVDPMSESVIQDSGELV